MYGGRFTKIIRVNKVKYILIYINNETDMMKAIFDSVMKNDQDEVC